MRVSVLLILFISLQLVSAQPEYRAVWLTDVASNVLTSKQNIAAAMDSLKKVGINVVLPASFNRGYTSFKSEVMGEITGYTIAPHYAGRDVLQDVITEAHRVGIEVHPWIEYGFCADFGGPGPILQSFPNWSGKRQSTGDARDDNDFYWLSQAHPEVQQMFIDLCLELMDRYDIDGIQLDRVRYGLRKTTSGSVVASDFGYDDAHLQRYRAEHNGQDPPAQPWNSAFVKWRSEILDRFVAALYDSLHQHNPTVLFSITPVIYPYGYDNFMQNWPNWVKQGKVDYITPQVYRYDINAYTYELDKIIHQQLPAGYNRFYAGMLFRDGSYNVSPQLAVQFIQANRARGIQGGCIWFYEGIPAVKEALRTQVYQEVVPLPYRTEPWRPLPLIVQEDEAGVETIGNWSVVQGEGAGGYYASDKKALLARGSSGASVRYSGQIDLPGWYDIFAHQCYGLELSAQMPVKILPRDTVAYMNGTDYINHGWVRIGSAYYDAGRHTFAEITTAGVPAGKWVAADAVMVMLNRRLTQRASLVQNANHRSLPHQFELLPNYPNPFNSGTTITFRLVRSMDIDLAIFDLRGRRLLTLRQGQAAAGEHRTILANRGMASGVYWLKLSASGATQTRKIVLLH